MAVYNFSGSTGSAGASLKIKSYESFPLTAEENEIGIIPVTTMNGYIASKEKPSEPDEGLVWIHISSSSNVEVPVNGRKTIFIYPIGVEQYHNGSWVPLNDGNAKCYQGGVWVTFEKMLYSLGTFSETMKRSDSSRITWENDHIQFIGNNAHAICTDNMFSLVDYRKIIVDARMSRTEPYISVGINSSSSSSKADPDIFHYNLTGFTTRQVFTVDISSIDHNAYQQGAVKIYFNNVATAPTINIYRLWLEG